MELQQAFLHLPLQQPLPLQLHQVLQLLLQQPLPQLLLEALELEEVALVQVSLHELRQFHFLLELPLKQALPLQLQQVPLLLLW